MILNNWQLMEKIILNNDYLAWEVTPPKILDPKQ